MASTEGHSHDPLPPTEVDLLASALHNALQPETATSPARHADRQDAAYRKDDKNPSAEVAPALLKGRVVLHLAESTPLKQISLQFRGKAKLPPLANEPVSFGNSAMTYTLCSHEWSFLEGEKKRSHTLKAGRHLFPFQLHLGGALPSTLYTDAYGGASVEYKLRAIATRPGFAHNLHTQRVITLLRSFGPEAIEYQQSLEIENTWPEKLMYSIMIPHKAWPAGDNLTAVVKFSPLAKGVRVLGVTTTLNETIKTFTRTGRQESTKTLIEVKHQFRNGQAVCVVHHDYEQDHFPRSRSRAQSGPPIPSQSGESLSPHFPDVGPSTSTSTAAGAGTHPVTLAVGVELSEGDIATKLDIALPTFTTPTHPLEPITATHLALFTTAAHTRRPSFDEAKSATAATRQLLLGGPEVPDEQDPDTVLPSYPSHIRDRVANVYLPDQAALRVTNPWLQHGISPVQHDAEHDGRLSSPTSGTHTPLEAFYVPAALGNGHGHGHGQENGTPELEYVNSELLLSLSQNAPPPPPAIDTPSTRSSSSRASRAPSRAPSPERDREPHSRRSSGGSGQELGGASTFVHESSSASRNLHGVFHTTMKPLTSLSSTVIPTRYHPHAHAHHLHPAQSPQHLHPPSSSSSQMPRTVPVTSHSQLHRVFTEVPDYGISSRGFIGGGVTPLETLQGLPSYEEAEMQRSRSESDLAAMAQPLRLQPLRRTVASASGPSSLSSSTVP
ncbi:hypothetical protein EI94DRAFT_1829403 [Lactarius quietus]|nr:hypothetical protein EI94DRAFT_1829403 [Lactarius quietus]